MEAFERCILSDLVGFIGESSCTLVLGVQGSTEELESFFSTLNVFHNESLPVECTFLPLRGVFES
jgi:hypothetical protein